MTLDHIVSALLFLCFLCGLLRGLLKQLISLIACLIGLAVAFLLPFLLSRYLVNLPILTRAAIYCFLGTALFIIFFAITVSRGKKLLGERALIFAGSIGDRLGGGVLAVVEGGVIVLIAVWLFDCAGGEWLKDHPRGERIWNDSRLVRWCGANDPLSRFAPLRRFKGFVTAAGSAEARERLSSQPAYERMVSNPRYRAVKDDDSLRAALKQLRWGDILRNGKLRALIEDESFWRDASAVEWEEAVEGGPHLRAPAGATPTASPVTTEPPVKITPTPPSGLSRVYLRNGSIIEGRIKSESPGAVVVEVLMAGGSLKMSLSRVEIDRIEKTRVAPAPAP